MSKKIKFHSASTHLEFPVPGTASRFIPNWFKKMPNVNDGVMSVKKCIPFIDAYSAGYIIPLPADMIWDSEQKRFLTSAVTQLNSDHHSSQVSGMDLGDYWDPQPHKWLNQWHIKVPKGYSILFTHPHNREDLPFKSFTGVVDADKHPIIINFPFVLKNGFEGTIPAGTPIIQILPFKREKWDSEVIDKGKPHVYERAFEVFKPPFAWYKRNFWTRKIYK